MIAYTATGGARIAYEGPYPAHIEESLKGATKLMCQRWNHSALEPRLAFRITRWKLTASQLDDLEMITGQKQLLLGVPVVKASAS